MKENTLSLTDRLFDSYCYVSDPLTYADPDDADEETLAVPGYRQLQSFSCGWVSALMVIHYFDRRRSPSKLWESLLPDPTYGTSTARMVHGLGEAGISCKLLKSTTWKTVSTAIKDGCPIIVTLGTERSDELHWVVIYGANHRTRDIFIAGNGIPYWNWLTDAHKVSWEGFFRRWNPRREAIICKKHR